MSDCAREERMEEFKKGLEWVFDKMNEFDDRIVNEIKDRVLRMWCVVITASRSELSINEMTEVYGELMIEKAFDRFKQWKSTTTNPLFSFGAPDK